MLNQFAKLSGILLIYNVGLMLSPIKLAEAAEITQDAFFTFSLDENFGSQGTGTLSFSYSGQELAGIGRETAKLSELLNGSFNFETIPLIPSVAFPEPFETILTFNGGDPTFTFESGFLVGINYQTQAPYTFSDGRYCSFDGGCVQGEGVFSLLLNGNQYTLDTTFISRNYNIYGELIDELTGTIGYSAGTIIFAQILPVEPIPEPLSILGVATAIGFGSYFKGKISQKNKL